jgi:hypothetical protein
MNNSRGGRRVNCIVVAALNVCMVIVAGDEEDRVHVTIGKDGAAGDFPSVIDEVAFPHRKARAVYNQAVQIDQRTSVLP